MSGKNSSRWYIVKMGFEVTSPSTGSVPDWGCFKEKFIKLKEYLIIYRKFQFLHIYSLPTSPLYTVSKMSP